ncbi:low molecular weight protein-tyrosine-phosphatase [uncultured Phascolarctobacterium sp.]|uniref:low molecular weight protein-tyrosine-phosphatase n=1 Tax=uncultured Phascolarctobacterium sp. TaxID=512296 RepID=UPI0025E1F617|nr:low molecular weight protein-tyrosine-phosphatase [uncultured Phascolarctobacterium sp.]
MHKILFICHGNICRSPMAEFLLKDIVRRKGVAADFEIASAATSREELGNSVHYGTKRKLAQLGISVAGKTARQVTVRDYRYYDLLLAMDSNNLRNLQRLLGNDAEGKIHLLLDYTPRAGQSIADPWYTGDFDITYDDIMEGLEGLLQHLGY